MCIRDSHHDPPVAVRLLVGDLSVDQRLEARPHRIRRHQHLLIALVGRIAGEKVEEVDQVAPQFRATGQQPDVGVEECGLCLLYTSPSPRDRTRYRMPSSA